MGEDGALTYHHMNPGYGNGTVSLGYQTYDVTPFLDGSDTAAVSVVAGTGWRNGMGSTTSQPALKALLAVTFGDGSRQLIQTNTTDWKGTLAGELPGMVFITVKITMHVLQRNWEILLRLDMMTAVG